MFSNVWYKIAMLQPKVYTPEQTAAILQLSKNTIYQLIERGEIVAKRIGKVYRIPQASLSFAFTGLDADLLAAEKTDRQTINQVQRALTSVRKRL